MKKCTKASVPLLAVLMLALFHITPVLARSDSLIQREIGAQITESAELRDTAINVRVIDKLVVLTGQVQLYEQELAAARIAWTTPGVFEVDNEIRVIPLTARSDAVIERKIEEILQGDEQFRVAVTELRVIDGEVTIRGKFLDFRIPSKLKHKVAKVEGVVNIRLDAAIVVRLYGHGPIRG